MCGIVFEAVRKVGMMEYVGLRTANLLPRCYSGYLNKEYWSHLSFLKTYAFLLVWMECLRVIVVMLGGSLSRALSCRDWSPCHMIEKCVIDKEWLYVRECFICQKV